ncbi:lytic polysaccharide monooxygenase [Enterobacter cloacae]
MKKSILRTAIFSMAILAVSCTPKTGEKKPRHGTVSEPISRQQLCYDGQDYHWPADGSNIQNPACKAAYQVNYNKYKEEFAGDDLKLIEQSSYLFIQKDEYAKLIPYPDYEDIEKVKKAIPDGTLCSANNTGQEMDSKKPYLHNDKSGNDIAAPWTAKDVTLNGSGEMDITWNATATHDPSFFEVYLSNDAYKASERPLKWSDLTLLKTIRNPSPIGSEYKFSVPVNNAKGTRVLFVRWQRIDPEGEGFYSCSDINIK